MTDPCIRNIVTARLHAARFILSAGLLLVQAACSGLPPPARPQAATDDALNPSGRPYDGPRGVLSSNPPADNNAAGLYCHPEGPGTVCARSP